MMLCEDEPSKTSLMAAHSSSVSAFTIPLRSSLQMRKGSAPTIFTAVPSLNGPTSSRVTRSPASRDRAIASPSNVSTPITLVFGLPMRFTYSQIPATNPPPPTAPKIPSKLSASGICLRISIPIVPWPAMTRGSS